MISPAVFWPYVLGLAFFIAGLWTYRRDVQASFVAIGPLFIAAPLAAFAGEHFTVASSIAQLVPKWLPARLFIAYFVGVALLAAALSLVVRRYVRWSALGLAIMFGLFVALMDLPSALKHPTARLAWVFPLRQGTYAMAGLALFAGEIRQRWPKRANAIATIARLWIATALIFYGLYHLCFPEYSPGVPDAKLTVSWVPLPHVVAYLTGILLIIFGAAMFVRKFAGSAGILAGFLMLLLTIVLYGPDFFLAHTDEQYVNAINFFGDTLLYSGSLFVIGSANLAAKPEVVADFETVMET